MKSDHDHGHSAAIEIEDTTAVSKGKAPLLPSSSAPARYGSNEKGLAILDSIVRVCAAVAALASAGAMGNSDQTLPFFTQFFRFQASYDDITTFQFFVIGMAIVGGYLFLSLPFSIVCIARPRAIGPRFLLVVLDTVALTLATASGAAAAAIVYLAHNGNPSANWFAICQQFGDFCKNASGAVVGSFVSVVLIVALVVLSAVAIKRI
ncbi:hypothetical protein MLD38_035540 [Melastoma candidum]|uniref:Uncharacterized protein n=1 Tax=Melastoma candidum TaxID=119954 RepID=A0ACB9LGX4_9MYRT|nr:hypothetical protein MLD38_035540 [Melastoma candidum]